MYPSKNFTYIGQVEINSNVLTIYLSDASKCFCFLVFNISVNIYFSPIKEREGEGGGAYIELILYLAILYLKCMFQKHRQRIHQEESFS